MMFSGGQKIIQSWANLLNHLKKRRVPFGTQRVETEGESKDEQRH
jgi:hypothetical protein